MHCDGNVEYPEFGGRVRLYSSDGTKYLDIYHDGTDAILNTSSGTIKQSDTETEDTIQAPVGSHLTLNTQSADKNVRINSRTITTDASVIGMQCKPRMGIATTNDVCAAEFSPGINDTFALTGFLMGINVDPILKGTSAGAVTGGVRVANLELVADDGGTRTISSYCTQIRMRMAFSSGTISGEVSCLRIETPETQTNSKNYTTVIEFPTENSGKWAKHAGSGRAFSTVIGSGGDQAAFIRVKIADTYYKIPCMNEA